MNRKSCAEELLWKSVQLYTHYSGAYFSSIAPGAAGINAPSGGGLFFLNSSLICSMVTNSTPSCFLKCSMSLSEPLCQRIMPF
jgi:hypothetical protein